MTESLAVALEALLGIFPSDPFEDIIDEIADLSSSVTTFISQLCYIIPLNDMVPIVTAWINVISIVWLIKTIFTSLGES